MSLWGFGNIKKFFDAISKLEKISENLSRFPDIQKLLEENKRLKDDLDKENNIIELRKALKQCTGGWCELSVEFQGHKPGCYCNLCFEKEKILFLLNLSAEQNEYYCFNCKNSYYKKRPSPPMPFSITQESPFDFS